MLSTWRISWRNILQNKKRFILILLAITFGVSFLTAMLITARTTDDVFDYYEQMYVADADYWVLSDEDTYPEGMISDIQADPTVTKTMRAFDKQAFLDIENERSLNQRSVRITGVDDQQNSLLKLPVKKGKLDNKGIVMTEDMADLLDKDVGDTLRFTNMGEAKISAIVEYTQLLVSPSSWERAESSSFRVLASLDMLREWTGNTDAISYMRFQVDGDGNKLFHSYQDDFKDSTVYIEPVVADDLQDNDIDGLYTFVYLIAVLSIFISGFIVFNMIYTSVIERKTEFAIMKSMGYTERSVSKLIFIEILMISLLATVIGTGLGIWFGDLFVQAILGIFEFDMVYTLNWQLPTLIAIVIGILFPIVFSIFPIYEAGRTSVLLTLKKSSTISSNTNIFRTLTGILLLCFVFVDHPVSYAAILVGMIILFPLLLTGLNKILKPVLKTFFHYPGTMAAKHLSQQLNRNANTAAIMAAGISIILLLGAVVKSAPEGIAEDIEGTYGGDMKVTSEAPWSQDEIDKVLSYKGVDDVERLPEAQPITWETTSGERRQFSVQSVSEDGPQLFQSSQSNILYDRLEMEPSIILGDRAFAEWGGDIGGRMLMNTPNGEQNFTVLGRVDTSQYSGYVGFMDEEHFRDEFGWTNSFDLLLTVNEDMSDTIRDQLWSDFSSQVSNVQTVYDEIDSTTSALSGMRELLIILMVMMIGLSSIGTANTLLMNTHERRFEIGTMRALGFTKKQIRNMVLAEGMLIGLSGVIGGILTGLVLIYITSTSKLMENLISFQLPMDHMAFAIIAGVFLSLCAAWISSRTASKMNILSSLKEG